MPKQSQKQYLFLVAVAAVKPDQRFKSSIEESGKIVFLSEGAAEYGPDIETEVGITPFTAIAPSASAAEKMGLDFAHEKFPPADGWLSHAVKLRFMDKKIFKEALTKVAWGEPPDDDDATEQELVM
jgi:hypothetical protein